MRPFSLRALLALAITATAACSDSAAPAPPLNATGLLGDLTAASVASTAPSITSLGVVGGDISTALAGAGGALGLADLPAVMLAEPTALRTREALQLRVTDLANNTAADIPASALGKTFVYDTLTNAYVPSQLTGAPTNGVRFILYSVDTATYSVIEPLVTVGYADLTRTVTANLATARVQVYSTVGDPLKVLDYSTTVEGTAAAPQIVVRGFARSATDSLAFSMETAFSLAKQSFGVTWRALIPSRGLVTQIKETIEGGETPRIVFDGIIKSLNGNVAMAGAVTEAGGALKVRVNGDLFATITLSTADDVEPTITGPTGQPLTAEQQEMLEQIFDWFSGAFDFFFELLSPVEGLIDLAIF